MPTTMNQKPRKTIPETEVFYLVELSPGTRFFFYDESPRKRHLWAEIVRPLESTERKKVLRMLKSIKADQTDNVILESMSKKECWRVRCRWVDDEEYFYAYGTRKVKLLRNEDIDEFLRFSILEVELSEFLGILPSPKSEIV